MHDIITTLFTRSWLLALAGAAVKEDVGVSHPTLSFTMQAYERLSGISRPSANGSARLDPRSRGFNQFFEEVSCLNRGLAAPDLVRTEQLMNAYGIELLGPALS